MSKDTKYHYPDIHISQSNLFSIVQFLTEISPPRNSENIFSLDRSAGFITERYLEYGFSPKEQKFNVDNRTYKNIIATYGDPDKNRIIIGAHYDVFDQGPGADDNASAVAGLLETARLFNHYAPELNHRIDFVAYTLEEPPFFRSQHMGSYIHASSLKRKDIKIKCMICLEMIGFYNKLPKSQKYPLPAMRCLYPNKGDFIGIVSNLSGLFLVNRFKKHFKQTQIPVVALAGPEFLPGLDLSDHRNFWEFGYKAVMITDTAFYRNPNYHQPTDTIDTLDFLRMTQVVKGLFWSVLNY